MNKSGLPYPPLRREICPVAKSAYPRRDVLNPFHWLVVENEDNDFLLVQRCCAQLPSSPALIRVENGLEAQNYLSRFSGPCPATTAEPPSLILSDLNMPQMDGLELLAWAKAQQSICDIPFIILTSSDSQTYRAQAEQLGVAEFLSKPLTLEELAAMVTMIEQRWASPHGTAFARLPAA